MADYQLTLTGPQIQTALNRANSLSSTTGQSNTVIMSQKGVTDAVEAIVSNVDDVTLDKRLSDGAFQIKEITQSDTTSSQTAEFGDTISVITETINTVGQVTGTDTKTITLPQVHIVADEAAALAASAGNPTGIYAWEEVGTWE